MAAIPQQRAENVCRLLGEGLLALLNDLLGVSSTLNMYNLQATSLTNGRFYYDLHMTV